MQKTLLIGYGNIDRQDDGVAWHVLASLARLFGKPVPDEPDEGFEGQDNPPMTQAAGSQGVDPAKFPDLFFSYTLQLLPEMAELLAGFERVCFIDAHTGNIAHDIQVVALQAGFQRSPFTHHMPPETLLAFAQELYRCSPPAILVSIRGYEFGFERSLSARCENLAAQAVEIIYNWVIEQPDKS